jgi:hypothetical protein
MALEINEIIVQVRVSEGSVDTGQRAGLNVITEANDVDREAIIAECTRRVLQRLTLVQAR